MFAIATGAFSKMGASIAGPVMIKLFGWRHTALSLMIAMFAGLVTAYIWELSPLNATFNPAGVEIVVCFMANWVGYHLSARLQ